MPEQIDHPREYKALLRGRSSQPNVTYFLTCCLQRPQSGLTESHIAERLRDQMCAIETDGFWWLRTWVIMPDHIHLLITLGENDELGDVMRTFKGPLTPFLRGQGLRWQNGYYEHRMRQTEGLRPTFLYIFLNPYRAGLIAPDQRWPWYQCAPEDWEWFGGITDDAKPFPEWLR